MPVLTSCLYPARRSANSAGCLREHRLLRQTPRARPPHRRRRSIRAGLSAHNNRRTGIPAGRWAARPFAAISRIAQKLQRHVFIVVADFRVERKDLRDLFLMIHPQHKCRIVEGLLRQQSEGLRIGADLTAFGSVTGNVIPCSNGIPVLSCANEGFLIDKGLIDVLCSLKVNRRVAPAVMNQVSAVGHPM